MPRKLEDALLGMKVFCFKIGKRLKKWKGGQANELGGHWEGGIGPKENKVKKEEDREDLSGQEGIGREEVKSRENRW